MSSQARIEVTKTREFFDLESKIEPSYLGGPTSLSQTGILATCVDSDILLLEVVEWEKIATLQGDGEQITALAISIDASVVVACSKSFQLLFYSVQESKMLWRKKINNSPVIVIALSSTSSLAALGSTDGIIRVWDVLQGCLKFSLKGHSALVTALSFGEVCNVKLLVSGAEDGGLRAWSLETGSCIFKAQDHASIVRSIAIDSASCTILSAARDSMVNRYTRSQHSLKKGGWFILQNSILVNEAVEDMNFIGAASDPAQLLFYTGGEDNALRIWSCNGTLIASTNTPESKTNENENPVSISKIGHLAETSIFFTFHSNTEVRQYDLLQDKFKLVKMRIGQLDEVTDLRIIDHDLVAIANNSEIVSLISQKKGTVGTLQGHRDIILCMDITQTRDYILTGSKDCQARLWNIGRTEKIEGKFITSLVGHAAAISAVSLPKNSIETDSLPAFMLTASEDLTVKKWISAEGSAYKSIWTRKCHDKEINAMDLAPDNFSFATASQDKLIKIFDIETSEPLAVLKGHKRGVWSVNYCKHDKLLASASGDLTIKIWSLNDYSCIQSLEGHTNTLLKVLWISKGKQLISAASDGLLKIWNAADGHCLTSLDGHEDRIWALDSLNEGEKIVSGGADGIVNFWKDATAERKEAEAKETEIKILKDQELSNCIREQNYKQALLLALDLNHPRRLYDFLTQLIMQSNAAENITDIIASLTIKQLESLLYRIRDWNINLRSAPVAQQLLRVILSIYSPQDFGKIPNCQQLLHGILAYTERQYDRTREMIQDSFVLDFVLQSLDISN